MPTGSVYSDDVRLLDDLTRLKLKVIQKKLNTNTHRENRDVLTPTRYRQYHHRRRYVDSPDSDRYEPETPPPLPPPERRRDRFYRKIDKRNELLHKLWEELGDGGTKYRRRDRYLPPLTPRRQNEPPIFAFNEGFKTGNTKKDLMELMLIQNAQMQQWLMTQTLAKRAGAADDDAPHHYHHYYGDPRTYPLPPIKKTDSGNQYPQDFFAGNRSPSPAPAAEAPPPPAGRNKRR
ncbi:uncharacterized protein LOC120342537 [Styela clava]